MNTLSRMIFVPAALSMALTGCPSSNNTSPPPKPQQQQTGQNKPAPKGPPNEVRPPSERGLPTASVGSVLHSRDKVTDLFSALLTSSGSQVSQISDQIVDTVFTNDDMVRPRLWTLQENVADIAQAGLYDDEAENRVAILHQDFQKKVKSDARARALLDGVFVIGTSAAIGVFAGTPMATRWAEIPAGMAKGAKWSGGKISRGWWWLFHGEKRLPSFGRSVASAETPAGETAAAEAPTAEEPIAGASAAPNETVATEAPVSEIPATEMTESPAAEIPTDEAPVTEATAEAPATQATVEGPAATASTEPTTRTGKLSRKLSEVKNRMLLPPENLAYYNLETIGVTPEELTVLRPFEDITGSDAISGLKFKNTEVSGLRYAEVDHWQDQDLGVHRRLALEVKRLNPKGRTTYLLSPQANEEQIRSIVNKLYVPEREAANRMRVYWLNPKNWNLTPIKTSVSNFMYKVGRPVKPLFTPFDGKRALGTGTATAVLTGLWYMDAYDRGQNNGELYADIDLERLVPASVKEPRKQPQQQPKEIRPPRGPEVSVQYQR